MRAKGRNTDSRAASTFLYALLLSLFPSNSLSPILAFWKWIDNRELGHVMKPNSRKNCDGYTWRKQDKGNLIRRDSILMYYNLSCKFYRGFTELSSWERSTHHFPCFRRGWVNRDTKSTRFTKTSLHYSSDIPEYFSGSKKERSTTELEAEQNLDSEIEWDSERW